MICRMPPKNNPTALLFFALFLLWAADVSPETGPRAAQNYREARSQLVSAYGEADYKAMRAAARTALRFRPRYPNALFNLALAEVLDSDPAASMQTLLELLSIGVDFGIAEREEFAPLRDLPEWDDYEAQVGRLFDPVGVAEVAASLDAPNFVPEGIAVDASGALYLGSVTEGALVRLGDEVQTLSTPANGHWSVFGMRFDRANGLWFASAAVAQFSVETDQRGRSGLFRLSLDDGEISHAALLPAAETDQVLGDLVIADDETLYATDSVSGAVYRYRIGQREFEAIVKPGVLGSPQGLVLDTSGDYLYVADYVGGLYRVEITSGKVQKISVEANVTDYGIDGLYRYRGQLIAIQNGVRPNRVIAMTLGDNGLSVTASRILAANLDEFDEPTLGAVADDHFYFVANSHWNRFDRDNNLPAGLTGPIILRLPLDAD